MLTINTNVASLTAQRALAKNTGRLEKSYQRLSTGLRINSARDDAAGLAISNRFTAQIRGLNQAVRNASDGISLAQTAEAALNEINGSLQRIRELSVQAANDTNTTSDRLAIQAEVDQLIEEIDRIATQSNFNNRKILDGSYTNATFQVGANAGETISFSLTSARIFNLGATATHTGSTVTSNALATGDLIINGIDVRATAATDDTFSTVNNSSSAIAKAAAINEATARTGVTAAVEPNTTNLGTIGADTFATGDLVINSVPIGGFTADAADATSAMRNAINAQSGKTGVQATLNTSNELVLTALDGRNIAIAGTNPTGTGGTAFGANPTGTYYGAITIQGDSDIKVLGTNPSYVGFPGPDYTVNTAVNVSIANVTTQQSASDTLSLMDTALRQVNTQQAQLGAIFNRLEATVAAISSAAENLSAARSRILDADFASETAEFSKNQILQQASTAVLSQANVSGQIALSLLNN